MPRNPPFFPDREPEPDTRPGPYDGGAAEPWFMPGPEEDEDSLDPFAPPRPVLRLVEPALWARAEADQAGALAALAYDHGRLTERLASMGQGARARLASAEAVAVGRALGDHVAADRLALWLSHRVGATGEDGEALLRVAWVARRLASPEAAGLTGLAALLGEEAARPEAEGGLGPLLGDAEAELAGLAELHPVTRGCAAFHLWMRLEERPPQARAIEAAVIGTRLAGQEAGFLPLALAGPSGLVAGGTEARRLSAWIAAAQDAVLVALLRLERLRAWSLRAAEATEDLSGRTPPLLLAALLRHPMLAAPTAEAETGASRAAVQRNLDTLLRRGLIREVTGHGRFRVWTAAL